MAEDYALEWATLRSILGQPNRSAERDGWCCCLWNKPWFGIVTPDSRWTDKDEWGWQREHEKRVHLGSFQECLAAARAYQEKITYSAQPFVGLF